MIEWISQLLIDYKYYIVVAGALLEGEAVLLLAGGAAYHGYMNIYLVMLIAFLGALLHDHALFFIGRYYGQSFLDKYQKVEQKSRKVFNLFHKYHYFFIMSFRFIYGLRTITPLVIGTSKLSLRKYSLLTTISAFIWAVAVAYIGYAFAIALETVIENFEKYQKYLAIILVLVSLAIWAILKYRTYLRLKKAEMTKSEK